MRAVISHSRARLLRLTSVPLLVVFVTLVGAPAAQAEDTVCVGTLVGGTYDNVVVPAGSICGIIGATVQGNVTNYGTFGANTTSIAGNVEAVPGSGFTGLDAGAWVGGNVQIQGGTAVGCCSGVRQATVLGDFQYAGNTTQLIFEGASIGGNAKLEKNTGGGSILLSTIGGNLECSENSPPIVASGNTVGGNTTCPG